MMTAAMVLSVPFHHWTDDYKIAIILSSPEGRQQNMSELRLIKLEGDQNDLTKSFLMLFVKTNSTWTLNKYKFG